MHSLQDKVAIVTGGAGGIGASIVKDFVKEGAKVTILDVNEQGGKNLVQELSKLGKTVQFIRCDVSNEEHLLKAFENVIAREGGIDVVVNNAGIADESFEGFKKQIALNYTGVISSTIRVMEIMRKDRGGKGGTIINVSSILGMKRYCPGLYVYGSIKSALIHFGSSIGMKEYFTRTNVRVMTMCFGITNTGILENSKSFDDQVRREFEQRLQYALARNSVQSAEQAAKGMVECYKNGESGSTWLVNKGVITDISNDVTKAYDILSEKIII
ncbi:15-hydroxyprostaglandin dehydrogenase [NAD(+)]-like [Pieris rapae]|uniref:15-hydroxyprostaglandin dehydrogenase [NAD(+)]-like n=1 Tax=Pieris rapae TaxID=64459 RepID=UPI001E281682|nr:15-hydroxyprostaglandin dehydrogenase [NAD(+)]-like [Pieris rapae]